MDDENSLEEVETKSLSLGLRLVIGLIAAIFIAIFAFSFLRKGADEAQSEISTDSTAAIVSNEPQSAEDYFQAGNTYYEAGQWAQAITAYQKAIELDPNLQAAYANLGVTYYQQQQFDLAASQYEKALELNPEDGDVAYNLGALYLQQALRGGEPNTDLLNRAVSQLQHASEMSPELAEPHFSLGVAYFALNQRAEAKQAFDTFLSLDSTQDPQAKQEVERYLKMLQGQ